MELALIAPKSHLRMVRDQSYHLVDTPWLEDPEIKLYYSELRKEKPDAWIILDNGLHTLGHSLDTDTIFEEAKDIGANEIVSPDSFRDGKQTLKAAENFRSIAPNDCSIIGAVQGMNLTDFVKCYEKIQEHVDVIAIPFMAFGEDTPRRWIIDNLPISKRPIHLFGCDDFRELKGYRKGQIRSIDTSLPFRAVHGSKIERTKRYEFTEPQLTTIREVIEHMRKVCAER